MTGVSRYAVVAEYQGARYGAGAGSGGPGPAAGAGGLRGDAGSVCGADRAASLIIADIRGRGRGAAAVGLIKLDNRSDLTLVPDLTNLAGTGQFSFLRFSLPPGAEDLECRRT